MSHRARWAAIGVALVAIALILVLTLRQSSPRAGVGYGVATAGANLGVSKPVARCRVRRVPCPSGELELVSPYGGESAAAGAFDSFRRQVLLAPGKSGYLRLWIAYDALYAWNPATRRCGWSPYSFGPPAGFNGVNGMALFAQLVWDVQGARALGLTPEVVFSAGSGDGVPHYPDPGYGDAHDRFAGVTTAGYDYACGVQGIIGWLRAELGASAPSEWEAFNEPDTKSSYMGYLPGGCAANDSCGVQPPGADYNQGGFLCGGAYAYCGELEAAELWELAQGVILKQHWSGQRIAALTLTDPESGYLTPYVGQMLALSACAPGVVASSGGRCGTAGVFPRYWAVHDYDDPTAGGTADLRAFESTLSRLAAREYGPLDVWVTEAGVELSSNTRADLNRGGCHGPANDGVTLGACVDRNRAAQAEGARVWKRLLDLGAPGVRTTEVFWFEFQLIPGWDSALVDRSGHPRESFCALVSGARCDGDAAAGPSAS